MADSSFPQEPTINTSLAKLKSLESDLQKQKDFWTGQEKYMRVLMEATQAIHQSLLAAVTTIDARQNRAMEVFLADRLPKSLEAAGIHSKAVQHSLSEIQQSLGTFAARIERLERATTMPILKSSAKENMDASMDPSRMESALAELRDRIIRQETILLHLKTTLLAALGVQDTPYPSAETAQPPERRVATAQEADNSPKIKEG
jgi:hypothetical protein